VPQDAIFYAGWAGADTLGPQYRNSNLKGVLDASAIPDFVSKTLPKLLAQAGVNNPNDQAAFAKIEQGLGVAWRHPTAFYFSPPDFANPRRPTFRFGLICNAGTDAKTINDLLTNALDQVPQDPSLPVRLVQDGTTVILTFGAEDKLADLKKGGGLAAAPAYKAAMAKVKQDSPALTLYIDVNKGLATINDALNKIPGTPAEAKARVPAVFDALGVNSFTQIALVAGFDGKGWSSHSYAGLNGPRKGFLSLVDGGPLSDNLLAMVPKDAAAFTAWKLDLAKIVTEVRSVISAAEPQARAQFDAGVAQAGNSIGLNIEKELIAPLGEEWISYSAPLSDQGGNSIAMISRLKDGPTFAKTITKLENLYNNMPNPPLKIEKITVAKNDPALKTEVSTLALGQFSVAWAVKNNNLYISSLNGIGGAIRQVENKQPSIIDNPDYKAARAKFPATIKPLTLSYANPAKLYPEFRGTVVGYFPILRRVGIDVPMELLPESADVAKFMTPGVTLTWSQPDGIYGAGNSAFPGAELLGGQQIGASALAGVAAAGAVALPQMARVPAGNARPMDQASLRAISQSALVYAADHKDAMPDDLANLVADGMIDPRSLVSRRSGTMPLEMTPELEKLAKSDPAKFAQQVAEHCDFVYLGKSTKSEVNAGIIVAYEKPGPNTPDGINVAFQDAHVEFVSWLRLPAAFEATNTYLKNAGRPQVNVDALVRQAPQGPQFTPTPAPAGGGLP
jgi:hypothetical protein